MALAFWAAYGILTKIQDGEQWTLETTVYLATLFGPVISSVGIWTEYANRDNYEKQQPAYILVRV